MNPRASKSHWQAVAQLMQLHAEAALAKSFQRVHQHLNQHSTPRSFSASSPWDVLQDALRVCMPTLSPLLARCWSALPREDCSGHPQKTVPSSPTPNSELSARSTSALCARAGSEGVQPLPEVSPTWVSHSQGHAGSC